MRIARDKSGLSYMQIREEFHHREPALGRNPPERILIENGTEHAHRDGTPAASMLRLA